MNTAPIEVGDRFASRDSREVGRVVEVRKILEDGRYLVENEAYPYNTSAIGRKSKVSEKGLRTRFRRLSR